MQEIMGIGYQRHHFLFNLRALFTYEVLGYGWGKVTRWEALHFAIDGLWLKPWYLGNGIGYVQLNQNV